MSDKQAGAEGEQHAMRGNLSKNLSYAVLCVSAGNNDQEQPDPGDHHHALHLHALHLSYQAMHMHTAHRQDL